MEERLVPQKVELPGVELSILQPEESAELPDDREVEWAPLVPYWTVLWRSGVALASEVTTLPLTGRRVLELGCGLGVPSLAAAAGGATVLASDAEAEAVELLDRNAALNGIELETAVAGWSAPDALVARGPFDLVLGADILYERQAVAELLYLLPRLTREMLIADPGRPASAAFLDRADERWRMSTVRRGAIGIHRIELGDGSEAPAG